MFRYAVIGMTALLASAPMRAHADLSCAVPISRDTAARIFAILNHPPSEAGCRFEGVETAQMHVEARWSKDGAALPAVMIIPRVCAPDAATIAGAFAISIPPLLTASCPSVDGALAELERQLNAEGFAALDAGEYDALYRVAQVLLLAIFLTALALGVRGLRRSALDPRWVSVGLAGFLAALAVRAALPFSLGNWYAEVLPAAGPPPWMRFGPSYFAFQSLLRAIGLWGPRALVVSQVVLGALALPLLLAVAWELHIGLVAASAALVLLVFAPFHARLSATPTEHVLASTLCLALLLSWLRAVRWRDWRCLTLTVLLLPAVCGTRIDIVPQVLAVLCWPLLLDRVESDRGARPSAAMLAVMIVATVATLALAYELIVGPSHHPAAEWAGSVRALRVFIPQFWWMATNTPPWISLSSVVLAIPGALVMAVRRPLLFVRVAGTLLIAFVALGRSFMHDELLGARYFLFTIPIFLLLSGFGFAALVDLVPARARGMAVAAGLVALAIWTGLAARSAYATRYAFEDEYAFARHALAQLPPDCTVFQVAIRADAIPHDADCCLDVPRSPLALEFPSMRFVSLPEHGDMPSRGPGCTAYYEGVACAITPGSPDRLGYEFAAKAAAYFQDRCAAVYQSGQLDLVAEDTTSPRTTEGFFDDQRPTVRLYRWP